MADVILIVVIVAFFVAAALLVGALDRMIARSGGDAPQDLADLEGAPGDHASLRSGRPA